MVGQKKHLDINKTVHCILPMFTTFLRSTYRIILRYHDVCVCTPYPVHHPTSVIHRVPQLRRWVQAYDKAGSKLKRRSLNEKWWFWGCSNNPSLICHSLPETNSSHLKIYYWNTNSFWDGATWQVLLTMLVSRRVLAINLLNFGKEEFLEKTAGKKKKTICTFWDVWYV